MSLQSRRPNPVFTDAYRALVDVLVESRRDAGLTQRALAQKIGKSASHLNMIEHGQRRVDALEFYRLAKACGLEPGEMFSRAASRIDALVDAAGACAAVERAAAASQG
jgi:transcriptional regulator with XRE-family HTH domain